VHDGFIARSSCSRRTTETTHDAPTEKWSFWWSRSVSGNDRQRRGVIIGPTKASLQARAARGSPQELASKLRCESVDSGFGQVVQYRPLHPQTARADANIRTSRTLSDLRKREVRVVVPTRSGWWCGGGGGGVRWRWDSNPRPHDPQIGGVCATCENGNQRAGNRLPSPRFRTTRPFLVPITSPACPHWSPCWRRPRGSVDSGRLHGTRIPSAVGLVRATRRTSAGAGKEFGSRRMF
jgi:hypothetical protein